MFYIGINASVTESGISVVSTLRICFFFDHRVMWKIDCPCILRYVPYEGKGIFIRPKFPVFIPFLNSHVLNSSLFFFTSYSIFYFLIFQLSFPFSVEAFRFY